MGNFPPLPGRVYIVPHGLTGEQASAFFSVVAQVQEDATAAERERICDLLERRADSCFGVYGRAMADGMRRAVDAIRSGG